MHFFVNHWPSRHGGEENSRHKREAAALRLREVVEAVFIEEPEARIMIMGDFNDEPSDKTLAYVLNAGEHYDAPNALVNLGWKQRKRGKGTVHHEGEWYLFDSIIVSTNLLGTEPPYIKQRTMYIYDEGETLFKEPRDKEGKPNRTYVGRKYKGGLSDHLAVFCRMATTIKL
jgi:hypothetical protein